MNNQQYMKCYSRKCAFLGVTFALCLMGLVNGCAPKEIPVEEAFAQASQQYLRLIETVTNKEPECDMERRMLEANKTERQEKFAAFRDQEIAKMAAMTDEQKKVAAARWKTTMSNLQQYETAVQSVCSQAGLRLRNYISETDISKFFFAKDVDQMAKIKDIQKNGMEYARKMVTDGMSEKIKILWKAMVHAETDRAACGLPSILPNRLKPRSKDKNDISGMTFETAEEYFKVLFDIKNLGTDAHKPYVDCPVDVVNMTMDGVKRCDLSILADYPDHLGFDAEPDGLPLFVTANFNVKSLASSFDGETESDMSSGLMTGKIPCVFYDDLIIVGRIGGVVHVFTKKNLKSHLLYCRQKFSVDGVSYLPAR